MSTSFRRFVRADKAAGLCLALLGMGLGCGSGVSTVASEPRDCDGNWISVFADEGVAFARGQVRHDSGDLTMVGLFEESLDLGGGALVAAGGERTAFVARFDSCGEHLYSRIPSVGAQSAWRPQPAGENMYFVQVAQDVSSLVKLDASGDEMWSVALGNWNGTEVSNLAATADGGVVVVGSYASAVTIGGVSLDPTDEQDGFVARFDADGGTSFVKSFFGESRTTSSAKTAMGGVAALPDGNVVVVGGKVGPDGIDLGGGLLDPVGHQDLLAVELDPAGGHVWSKRFGGSGQVTATGAVTNSDGNVVVVGSLYNGTCAFGGPEIDVGTGGFVVTLGRSGEHVATLAAPAIVPLSLEAGSAGDVVLSGETFAQSPRGLGDFELQDGSFVVTLNGQLEVGAYIHTAGVTATAVDFDPDGSLVMAGALQFPTTLDGQHLQADDIDVVQMKLAP